MIHHCAPGRQLFWVVFHDRVFQRRRWYHIFNTPGFYHCFVMKAGIAGTIVLNPMMKTWLLDWIPQDIHETVTQLLHDDRYRVLVIDRPPDASYNRFGLIYCVSAVKSCLAIKSRAITPFQLYRDLLQMGAVEVKL